MTYSEKKSSKISPLNIPVPNFKFFHKPSSEEEIDDTFIGREEISETLTNWLENGDTGSYLVSGYRGMGKSSFVGKVLNEIAHTDKEKVKKFHTCYIVFCTIFLVSLFAITSCFFLNFAEHSSCVLVLSILFSVLSLVSIIFLLCRISKKNTEMESEKECGSFFERWYFSKYGKIPDTKNQQKDENQQKEHEKFKEYVNQHHYWFKKFGINFRNGKNKNNKIIIKINLGHEILNERDVLSLIAKRIYEELQVFVQNIYTRRWTGYKLLIFSFFSFCFLFFGFFLNANFEILYQIDALQIGKTFKIIKEFIENSHITVIFANLIWLIGFYFLINFCFNKFVTLIPYLNRKSSGSILADLKHLTDRIDTTINENTGPNANYNSQTSLIGISFSRKRSKTYSLANVREIESELIQILERINNISFSSKPQFIIVFDELDKIDPEYNYDASSTKDSIPEYDNSSNGFPNSMVSRKRKHNVLRLLGNMKLFVSSAKAKFIFISGRELYDAYLADLSDREFAISSIFNGAIYVDSFFDSNTTQKNIIGKTEEYICQQLIPKKYYLEKAKKYFQTNPFQRLTPNLRLYNDFLKEEVFKNELTEEDEFFIDKVTLFLFQFSVYLSHISNGSPKKIALYFEKYVKRYYKDHPKNLFHKNKYSELNESEYCLSFSISDQQSIGFIHYIAYPILQAIVNKSSQYGDKLLVSASFLIDHIYKHHKGGFSRDNIEHIPELLEVHRTPELRNFINSIISFLGETHLTIITSGLYYYKFRKRISDEISYFSKISEEVSAVFNFTLDESLSVKSHYYQQMDNYLKLYSQHIESSRSGITSTTNPYSMPLIQLNDILGELHLLDDEFSDAIIKFQSGLELIKSEIEQNLKANSPIKSNNSIIVLLFIQNVLKLGLTYECQKTYNLAYAVYCELLSYLIEYRYIDESSLGLSYAYRNNNDVSHRRQLVFYHENTNNAPVPDTFKKEVSPDLMENKKNNKNNSSIDYSNVDYILSNDDSISRLSKPLTPSKNSIISRLTLFEDIQFMYQIILAKLFVLEKIDLSGITKTNLDVAENEFAYMNLIANPTEKFLLAADFYRKLGAILYLKNGIVQNDLSFVSIGLKFWGYDIYSDINDFCLNFKNIPALSKECIPMEVLYEFANKLKIGSLGTVSVEKNGTIKKEKFVAYMEKFIAKILYKMDMTSDVNEKKKIIISFFKSDYFSLPQEFLLDKLKHCSAHFDKCKERGWVLPCYACSYFSRSLGIFSRYLLKKDETNGLNSKKTSRIFNFINNIPNNQAANLRTSYLSTIASTLRGMGDIQLSCAIEEDIIDKNFLNGIFDVISNIIKNKGKESSFTSFNAEKFFIKNISFSRLEKSILYYWTASEYFHMASSYKDTTECLRKILQLFISYLRLKIDRIRKIGKSQKAKMEDEKNKIIESIDAIFEHRNNIKELIVQKAIMNIYTEYENINIAEIQNLKWIFGIDNIKKIDLNKLSNFPDIEELILLYCEFELLLSDYFPGETKLKKLSIRCYNSIILSPYRNENSMYEKIHSLRFKALMNKSILDDIINKTVKKKIDYHGIDFTPVYFDFLQEFLLTFHLNECSYNECFSNSGNLKKLELLMFLISDSIFCLTQIIETLSVSRFSQFPNSFLANIYHELFCWTQLFTLNNNYLLDLKNNDSKNFDDLKGIIEERVRSLGKSGEEKSIKKLNDKLMRIKQIFEEKIVFEEKTKEFLRNMEDNLLKDIGHGNRHFLTPNYCAEMAIKYYNKTFESHNEGIAYKEMLSTMYVLDDDINNANMTFSLAVERYMINSNEIYRAKNLLKQVYGKATYYKLGNFLRRE